ncbi:MAG: CooT family nickel-binding protein [Syntrophales bacterium]
MCLAKVYLPGTEGPVLEDVTHIAVENGKITASTLFGEQRVFEATIKAISFSDSKVELAGAAG